MFNKEIFRTITHSWARFVAIFAIVGLGVGFYAGLKMTAPDMRLCADEFYDDTNLSDIRVVSTLGMSDSNIDALREVSGVKQVMPAYETDVVAEIGDEPYVVRVHSLPDDNSSVNSLVLASGRLPEAAGECVMSADRIMNKPLVLGDKVIVTECSTGIEDTLSVTEYTVVGLVHSSYYASSTSMGTSSLGSGLVQQFMYVQDSDFSPDFPITEAFITVSGARELNSSTSDYDKLISEVMGRIETIQTTQEQERTHQVKQEAQDKLDEERSKFDSEKADVYKKLDNAKVELDNALATIQDSESKLQSGRNEYESGLRTLSDQRAVADAEFARAQTEIDTKRAQLAMLPQSPPDAVEQLDAAQAELDAKKAATYAQFESGQAKLDSSRIELEEGERNLASGRDDYNSGLKEYEENKAKADSEFADAEKKLADAQAEIDDIKDTEWLVMDRSKNFGAESFDMDAGRIDNIAQVFPLVFFLVAALVALTTMTRMVDEERMKIGTFKALGYSRARITSKYLLYAFLASLLGSIVGILMLSMTLPAIIMSAYSIVYIIPTTALVIDPVIALTSAGVGIAITLVATASAALSTLRESPAALMLPPAPKAGKKIILERITPLWSHLSFLWKVTCRNILRYKKRLFMTVIGIAGCTALLLTGFGLHNSINDIIDKHYGEIISYNVIVTKDDDVSDENTMRIEAEIERLSSSHLKADLLDEPMVAVSESKSVGDLAIELVVPENVSDLESIWEFRERVGGSEVELSDNGAVITEKLATWFNVKPGDKIRIAEQDDLGNATNTTYDIVVTGIIENYIAHRVFITPKVYEKTFGHTPDYNCIYVASDKDRDARDKISADIRELEGVKTVSFNDETIDMYRNALNSVNMVVVVLIIAAALLAFIVLYNLVNINVSERAREIATLKVLGFTRKEVFSYIFREILILALLGGLFGLLLGTMLENFVVVTAEVNGVMFGRDIHLPSYLYAMALTMVFAMIVAVSMRGKLRSIDMVESLKSIE